MIHHRSAISVTFCILSIGIEAAAQSSDAALQPAAGAPSSPKPLPAASPPAPAAPAVAGAPAEGSARDETLLVPQRGEGTAASDAAIVDADAAAEYSKPKKKKKKKGGGDILGFESDELGRLEIGGRVFARAELESREVGTTTTETMDLSVPSARIDVSYRAPVKWLSVDIEFDVAENPEMKDGYIQAKGDVFFARAGQFKPPVSAFQMESPWTLPVARRGQLSDLLLDYLDIAGRRPGVLVGVRARNGIRPRLSVGAFQGSYLQNSAERRDIELIERQGLESQSFAARADARIGPAEVGLFYQLRVGAPDLLETNHYSTAGLDVVVDHTFDAGGLRLWFDTLTGSSWYEHENKEPDDENATFLSGRLLVAYRFGGLADDEFYLEPFALGSVLDPDLEITADWAWEGVIGLNAGFWRRARLTLQGEINGGDENFPTGSESYFWGAEPDRLALTLQAGVAF